MKFSELGLIPHITANLKAMGYVSPTPIQRQAIPPALAGRDVLGCAQTGTGKTCAFAAPILQRLAGTGKGSTGAIRALVLTPTRELALQIQENFEAYGKGMPLRSAVIFGGVGQAPQVEKIKKGLDILVATPGRLLDLHGQGLLDLSHVGIFVLDEADRMLDMGFIHDVRRALKLLPKQKQTLFFSATMPPEVMELVDGLLHDPAKVAVDPISSPVEVIDQCVYFVDKGNKTKLLGHLIRENNVSSALVFTRTKHGANKVAQELSRQGLAAAAIHGNKSQTARQKALADFKSGEVRILVATDIAARGLDIEELPYVFNYNLPEVPETYVHRIGRTGRAGREGVAVAFCDFGEQDYLKGIEKLIGRKLPVKESRWPMEVLEANPKETRTRLPKMVKPNQGKTKQEPTPQPEKAPQEAPVKQAQPPKAEKTPKKEKKAKQEKPAVQEPVRQPAGMETKKEQPAKAPKSGKRKNTPPMQDARPVKETKPAEQPKAETAIEKPAKKKFAPPRKTLAEFEAEERAFQERIARERKERNTVRQMGALAGEVIMDATARLLAPRKPAQPVRPAQSSAPKPEKTEPKKQGKKEGGLFRKKAEKQPQPEQKQPEQKPEKGKKKAEKQPAKPGKAGKQSKSAEHKAEVQQPHQAAAQTASKGKKEKKIRGGAPRPVELRSGRIKDSTEQPSLMKPFYFGPED